jgi:hypothetical protein
LPVKIKARLRVLLQRAVADELLKILRALRINFRRIRVRARRQINLRLADVQKLSGLPAAIARASSDDITS